MNPRKHQQGLTVIEVIIVLGILVILALMVLPMFSGGGPNSVSKSTRCIVNLKQIAVGFAIYTEENTNKFPNLDQQQGNDGPAALALVSKYTKDTNRYICPWVAYQRRGLFRKPFEPVMDRAFFISNGNDYAYYDGLSLNSVTNPSATAITADRFAWTNRSAIDKKLLNHPDGAINIGFVDGHVERVRSNIVIGTNYTPPWSRTHDPIRIR